MSPFNPQRDVVSASPQPSGGLPPSAADEFASNQAVPVGGLPDAEDASPDAQPCEAPDDGAEGEVGERSFQQVRLSGRRPGRRLVKPEEQARAPFTATQRLLILDSWQRSGLPAGDFAGLVNVSKHTLYAWKKAFAEQGPAGLAEQPRGGPKGSRLPEITKRAILMLKQTNPEWGCQRISDMLLRGPALPASASAVARVLHEAGYELEEVATHPHPDKVRHFERAKPNQLWQTDLFTFVLKRQNRRVYLVAFMDDHSRFIVCYGLHASQSSALVLEVLRAGIASYGAPEEILTDNGSQYVTWRGKSAFSKELEKRGVRQVVARPRHPQTLGKIERFWGTLWRECIEAAVFVDLEDARRRIGHFLDHYNFQRSHGGIDGLVPADRYFGAAADVLRTLKERVAGNALDLARHGVPKTPFYVTGQVAGKTFSVHAEGDRVILTREGQAREEVDLASPPAAATPAPLETISPSPAAVCPDGSPPAGVAEDSTAQAWPPGSSPLDEALRQLAALNPSPPSAEASSAEVPSLEAPLGERASPDADAAGGVS